MATWETQAHPFHEAPSSLWSLKPSEMSEGSKSLLTALNRRASSNPSLSSNDLNNVNNKLESITTYQTESAAGAGAGAGYSFANRSTMLPSSADTSKSTEYNLTTSTTVATIPRAPGSKSTTILTASASAGGVSTKVAKKRARASRKPPTTVLEADSSNFRAMVQQLTGIPVLPAFLSTSLHHHQRNGLEFLDLVRPSSKSLLGFGAAPSLQGLPPLDTSSLILGRADTGAFSPPPPPYFKYNMSAAAASQGLHHPRQTPSMGDFLRTPLDELGLDNSSQHLLNSLQRQQEGTQVTQQQSSSQHAQHQQQQQQHLQEVKLDPSMPLLWDGDENSRELQLEEEMSKYKLATSETVPPEVAGDEIADHDGASSTSRMARIVDSWLSHADPAADASRSNNQL